MAGGPLFPFSVVPVHVTQSYPAIFEGTGGNSEFDYGLGVLASIASNTVWDLRYWLPPALPSGTMKLILLAMANATSGAAKVNPKWASVSRVEGDPSGTTLFAEGTSTLTWTAGDNEDYLELSVTLDADTPVANEILVMALTFESTGWTLGQNSIWTPAIIWE